MYKVDGVQVVEPIRCLDELDSGMLSYWLYTKEMSCTYQKHAVLCRVFLQELIDVPVKHPLRHEGELKWGVRSSQKRNNVRM